MKGTNNTSKQPRKRLRAPPSPNAFAYTFGDAQAMGGPGRTKSYELVKSGRLQLLKVDGRSMLGGASLRKLLGVEAD